MIFLNDSEQQFINNSINESTGTTAVLRKIELAYVPLVDNLTNVLLPVKSSITGLKQDTSIELINKTYNVETGSIETNTIATVPLKILVDGVKKSPSEFDKVWVTEQDVYVLVYDGVDFVAYNLSQPASVLALEDRVIQIEQALPTKVDKSSFENAQKKVVSDISIQHTVGESTSSILEKKINIETGVVTQETSAIPIASETDGGLMSKESFKQIIDNTNRILALEQQGGKFIGVSFNTYADMESYTIPNTVNIGDFTYVLIDETHDNATTRYIVVDDNGTKKFQFAYIINEAPVGLFSDQEAGLIKGSNPTEAGKILAENDGTGSVIGWDDLNNKVNDIKDTADNNFAFKDIEIDTETIQATKIGDTLKFSFGDGFTVAVNTETKEVVVDANEPTGAITTVLNNNLTNNRVVVSNSAGKLASSAVTSTELGRLSGVTDNIQNQLNSKVSRYSIAGPTVDTWVKVASLYSQYSSTANILVNASKNKLSQDEDISNDIMECWMNGQSGNMAMHIHRLTQTNNSPIEYGYVNKSGTNEREFWVKLSAGTNYTTQLIPIGGLNTKIGILSISTTEPEGIVYVNPVINTNTKTPFTADDKVLLTDGINSVKQSDISSTELNQLSGVKTDKTIQQQINDITKDIGDISEDVASKNVKIYTLNVLNDNLSITDETLDLTKENIIYAKPDSSYWNISNVINITINDIECTLHTTRTPENETIANFDPAFIYKFVYIKSGNTNHLYIDNAINVSTTEDYGLTVLSSNLNVPISDSHDHTSYAALSLQDTKDFILDKYVGVLETEGIYNIAEYPANINTGALRLIIKASSSDGVRLQQIILDFNEENHVITSFTNNVVKGGNFISSLELGYESDKTKLMLHVTENNVNIEYYLVNPNKWTLVTPVITTRSASRGSLVDVDTLFKTGYFVKGALTGIINKSLYSRGILSVCSYGTGSLSNGSLAALNKSGVPTLANAVNSIIDLTKLCIGIYDINEVGQAYIVINTEYTPKYTIPTNSSIGDTLYLSGSLNSDGNFVSDGTVVYQLGAGKSYIPIGYRYSNTTVKDIPNKICYTFDANNNLTHINGRKLNDSFIGKTLYNATYTSGEIDKYTIADTNKFTLGDTIPVKFLDKNTTAQSTLQVNIDGTDRTLTLTVNNADNGSTQTVAPANFISKNSIYLVRLDSITKCTLIGASTASTGNYGMVLLRNTLNWNETNTALTAAMGKKLNDEKQAKFMTGTCATLAATAIKEITLDSPWSTITPAAGDIFLIKFANGNNSSMRLKINGTSEKYVYLGNGQVDRISGHLQTNQYAIFIYNGSNYQMMGSQDNSDNDTLSITNILESSASSYKITTLSNIPTDTSKTTGLFGFNEDGQIDLITDTSSTSGENIFSEERINYDKPLMYTTSVFNYALNTVYPNALYKQISIGKTSWKRIIHKYYNKSGVLTANSVTTDLAQTPIYIGGIDVSGQDANLDGLFIVPDEFSLTLRDTSKVYKRFGQFSSTGYLMITSDQPTYKYIDGKWLEVTGVTPTNVQGGSQKTSKEIVNEFGIYQWNGENSTRDPSVLAVWQEIYDASRNKPCMVYSANGGYYQNQAVWMMNADLFKDNTNNYFRGLATSTSTSTNASNGVTQGTGFPTFYCKVENGVVTNVTEIQVMSYIGSLRSLPTTGESVTNYTPTYDYHPSTKKYVDDRSLKQTDITIPTTGWTLNSTTNEFEYSYANTKITATTLVNAVVTSGDLTGAYTDSYAGGVKIITSTKPTEEVELTLTLQNTEVL